LRQLFSIEDEGNIVLQDNTFLLIEEFKDIYDKYGDNHVRYLVLVHDHYSPYRELTISEREKEVCVDVFNKTPSKVKDLRSPLMKLAIEKYKKLQYDPTVEQYKVYTEKIHEYNQWLLAMPISSDNSKTLSDAMLALEKITEAREKLKEIILKKEEESKMMGGGEASLLEEILG